MLHNIEWTILSKNDCDRIDSVSNHVSNAAMFSKIFMENNGFRQVQHHLAADRIWYIIEYGIMIIMIASREKLLS